MILSRLLEQHSVKSFVAATIVDGFRPGEDGHHGDDGTFYMTMTMTTTMT